MKRRVEGLTNNTYRIVRTESHRAVNQARLEGFEKAENSFERLGIKSWRKGIASPTPKVDRHYPVMNGQPADKNDEFHFPDDIKTKVPDNRELYITTFTADVKL